MSSEISSQVMINLPLEQSWEKLKNFTSSPNYVPNLTHCELHEGPSEGVGASRRVYQKNGQHLDETIIHWQEQQGFIMRLHKGDKVAPPFKEANFRYKIKAVGDQTEMTTTMTYELGGGLFGKVIDRLLFRIIVKGMVKKIAGNLKSFYETGQPVNPAMISHSSL